MEFCDTFAWPLPSTNPRSFATISRLIGMVVPDVTNPLFPPMVRGAERVLTQAGYTLVLTDTDNDAALATYRGQGGAPDGTHAMLTWTF